MGGHAPRRHTGDSIKCRNTAPEFSQGKPQEEQFELVLSVAYLFMHVGLADRWRCRAAVVSNVVRQLRQKARCARPLLQVGLAARWLDRPCGLAKCALHVEQ